MASDRPSQIERLYRAVKALPTERATLLRTADEDIRAEVERLLDADEQSTQFGGGATIASAAAPATAIVPGELLGPYRIGTTIGLGGMGQVFRAIDTRLNRPVAIKTSHLPF